MTVGIIAGAPSCGSAKTGYVRAQLQQHAVPHPPRPRQPGEANPAQDAIEGGHRAVHRRFEDRRPTANRSQEPIRRRCVREQTGKRKRPRLLAGAAGATAVQEIPSASSSRFRTDHGHLLPPAAGHQLGCTDRTLRRAASTTASVVMPNWLNRVL